MTLFSYLLFAAELIVIDPESLFLIGSDAISKVAEAIIFIADSVPKSIFSRCASMSGLYLSPFFSSSHFAAYRNQAHVQLLLIIYSIAIYLTKQMNVMYKETPYLKILLRISYVGTLVLPQDTRSVWIIILGHSSFLVDVFPQYCFNHVLFAIHFIYISVLSIL